MQTENYESPSVEVLTVVVEKGFQASGNGNSGITAPEWGII